MEIFENHCHVLFLEPIEDTLKGFEKEAEELGISRYGLLGCPRNDESANPMIMENLKCLYLKERMSIPTYMYAGFDWHYDDGDSYVRFAKSMLEMGADGFKSMEEHPKVRNMVGKGLNDFTFDPFFDYIGKNKVPIICHVGNPRPNWDVEKAPEVLKAAGRVYDESYPALDELYGEMEQVFLKHPDVKIVLAHFYFKSDDYDGLSELMEKYPNIYLDLTPGAEMFVGFSKDLEKWRDFFLRYKERIVLGSDLYGAGYGVNRHKLVRRYLETAEPFVEELSKEILLPMNFSEDILSYIYGQNAIRISAEKPRPVNHKMAYELCREVEDKYWDQLADVDRQNLKVLQRYWKKLMLDE